MYMYVWCESRTLYTYKPTVRALKVFRPFTVGAFLTLLFVFLVSSWPCHLARISSALHLALTAFWTSCRRNVAGLQRARNIPAWSGRCRVSNSALGHSTWPVSASILPSKVSDTSLNFLGGIMHTGAILTCVATACSNPPGWRNIFCKLVVLIRVITRWATVGKRAWGCSACRRLLKRTSQLCKMFM